MKFCIHCGATIVAPPPAPARTAVSHVEGQAVIIGDNARQQISYYGDIIVRVDSLEELPPTPGEPPYKGLTYYTEADAAIFFGREQLSDDLAARLETTAFLAVAGASGSGKSSLLRAGVVPRLRRRNWLAHVLTPTAAPLAQLAATLTRDDPSLSAADELRAGLGADPQTLRRKAGQLVARAGAARLLLVVDQFEELFTQCHDETGRRAFIDNLLAAAQGGSNVTVLIGLRADFTGRLTEVEELRALVEQNFALLGPMQQADLVRVILEPARLGGWAFVSGLVEQFLSDVGQEPGRLPLLSHALLETWARRSSHVMTLKGYRAAGGVEGAIARTAEDTLRRLDKQTEQPVMQAVFLALTELGEGSEDTRRIARRDELARAGDATAVAAVLDTLAAARLVTVDADSVQVAHEALIRRWPRLREWLADNRERLRFERQLEADALEWQAYNHDVEALYGGARLAAAQEWRKGGHRLSPLVAEFLDRSVAEVEREAAERENEAKERIRQQEALRQEQKSAGRFKRLSRWLTAAAVFAAIATIIAGWFGLQARSAMGEVEQLNRETRSRRLAAEAENILADDQEAALLLAAAAYHVPLADGNETTDEARAALYHVLDTPYRMTLAAHAAWVNSAAFSPDGARALTASDDGTARVWDVANGEQLTELAGHRGSIYYAAFSPDGTQVMTASEDGEARIWDATSGETLTVLDGLESRETFVAFSPDGLRVVSTDIFGSVRIWDVASGEQLLELVGHEEVVSSVAFSRNGTRLVTASLDGTALIWDAESGQAQAELAEPTDNILTAVFSLDGTQVVTGTNNGVVRLWDAASGEMLATLEGHTSSVSSATFSPDGTRIVTTSWDSNAFIWDAASGEPLAELVGHKDIVWSAAFSPDATRVVTVSDDQTAIIWDAVSGKLVAKLVGHAGPVRSVAFSPDSNSVVTASLDHTARVWSVTKDKGVVEATGDFYPVAFAAFTPNGVLSVTATWDTAHIWAVTSGEVLAELVGHQDGITYAGIDPEGKLVVTASWDGTTRLWDAASGEMVVELVGHKGVVARAAFSLDGSRVVTASGDDGTAIVWDTSSGEQLAVLAEHQGSVSSTAFSPDGARVVTTSGSTVRLWDASNGEQQRELTLPAIGFINSIVYSPDGLRFVTASGDGIVRLWDATNGIVLVEMVGHTYAVNFAAFSPDGTRVISASDDRTVRVWDATSGEELTKIVGHDDAVSAAMFSPDGARVVTASVDGTARLWDGVSGKALALLSGHEGAVYSAMFNSDGTLVVTVGRDGTARLWAIQPTHMLSEAQRRLRREPTDIIPDFCTRYFQDAPEECPDTLAKLFPEAD